MKLLMADSGETVQEASTDSWGSGAGRVHSMVRLPESLTVRRGNLSS